MGGNVSLYNEGARRPDLPDARRGDGRSPARRRARGAARVRARRATRSRWWDRSAPSLAASELAKLRGEPLPDGLPEIDLEAVLAAQAAVREAVRAGALSSAHDIAEGGLAVALAECCLAGALGAMSRLASRRAPPSPPSDTTARLFGEGPGGFVVSGPGKRSQGLAAQAPLRMLGTVGGDGLTIATDAGTLSATLAELAEAHGALAELFP